MIGMNIKTFVVTAMLFCANTTTIRSLAQTIQITTTVVQPDFTGLGHNQGQNVDYNTGTYGNPQAEKYYTKEQFETVIGKRLRETCAEGFFRNFQFSVSWYAPNEKRRTWEDARFINYCKGIQALKDNDIDVIHTSAFNVNPQWLNGGRLITDPLMQEKFAETVAEGLEYLIRKKGFTNIKAWELTNEMCYGGVRWAGFYYMGDSARVVYTALHRMVKKAFQKHKLDFLDVRIPGLNNDDAWKWAMNAVPLSDANQSDIHWYIKKNKPNNTLKWDIGNGTRFPISDNYSWDHPREYFHNLAMYKFRVATARAMGRELCVGEFGPSGDGVANKPEGSSFITMLYGKTGSPMAGVVMAEQTIAMLNAGIKNIQKWCWIDLRFGPKSNFYFGSMKDASGNFETRPDYDAYGLLTRYIRKNSTVYDVEVGDSLLRATAVKNNRDGHWTIVVLNRKGLEAPIEIRFTGEKPSRPLRRFIYDPNNWERNRFGDLQKHTGVVAVGTEKLTDTVEPNVLAVYTTEYDEEAPAKVKGFTQKKESGGIKLTWQANAEKDFCYYRVYRGTRRNFTPSKTNQLVSTIGTSYVDRESTVGFYTIIAVDKYGNESPAVSQ